jgi:hypothetical protein
MDGQSVLAWNGISWDAIGTDYLKVHVRGTWPGPVDPKLPITFFALYDKTRSVGLLNYRIFAEPLTY